MLVPFLAPKELSIQRLPEVKVVAAEVAIPCLACREDVAQITWAKKVIRHGVVEQLDVQRGPSCAFFCHLHFRVLLAALLLLSFC